MITVLIPMAGQGSRFSKAGYFLPKPLIDVNGVPMIEAVVKSLDLPCKHVFIVSKAHVNLYPMMLDLLKNLTIETEIVVSDKPLHGAASSCLEASSYIDDNSMVLIANCDQIMKWNPYQFINKLENESCDALIHCYKSQDPKNSFVWIQDEKVTKVVEKEQISDIATTGIYGWKSWKDFVVSVETMMQKNKTVNGEYYVGPAYNEFISNGASVKITFEGECYLIGTPEDLDYYLTSNNRLD